MLYLFAAFACVWIGLFLYLYMLVRRGEALAHEVAALREQSRKVPRPATPAPASAGRSRVEPS
jgi:CcmD family protein